MTRRAGKVTASASIDMKKYSRLLAAHPPISIETEEENEDMLEVVNELMSKGEENLTPEENRFLNLLVTLIEKFETDFYGLEKNRKSTPLSALKFLMEQQGRKPKDLWEVLGSKGVVSEVLNGHRGISKSGAKALAEYFHVSAELFI